VVLEELRRGLDLGAQHQRTSFTACWGPFGNKPCLLPLGLSPWSLPPATVHKARDWGKWPLMIHEDTIAASLETAVLYRLGMA